jgi:uncharacterized protein (TIGR02301 family)
MRSVSIVCLLAGLLLAPPVLAQTEGDVPPVEEEVAPAEGGETVQPALPEPPPPYEKELFRLAEVLGSVHFLRAICGHNDGQVWRERMEALIMAEEPSDQRRAALVARFNEGYSSYSRSYRSCTDAAVIALDRYMREGAELAGGIASRFGT